MFRNRRVIIRAFERYFTEVTSPLITLDDFRDPPPPPCLYFPSIFEWSPSESFQSFKRSSLFGFLVTTDPPFCSPKNQVISPKIVRHPPPPPAINNDRSLTAGYFVGRSQKPRSALALACSLRSRTVELSKKRKKNVCGQAFPLTFDNKVIMGS